MNDADLRAALFRLEAQKTRSERHVVHHFGSGPFALMAVFDDGSHHLKAVGFDSVDDAALFRTYAEGINPDADRLEALMQSVGYTVKQQAKWLRLDIVRIVAHVDELRPFHG